MYLPSGSLPSLARHTVVGGEQLGTCHADYNETGAIPYVQRAPGRSPASSRLELVEPGVSPARDAARRSAGDPPAEVRVRRVAEALEDSPLHAVRFRRPAGKAGRRPHHCSFADAAAYFSDSTKTFNSLLPANGGEIDIELVPSKSLPYAHVYQVRPKPYSAAAPKYRRKPASLTSKYPRRPAANFLRAISSSRRYHLSNVLLYPTSCCLSRLHIYTIVCRFYKTKCRVSSLKYTHIKQQRKTIVHVHYCSRSQSRLTAEPPTRIVRSRQRTNPPSPRTCARLVRHPHASPVVAAGE